MPANTRAKAKVMMVTTTMRSIVFCIARMKYASLASDLKLLKPTKVSVGEYAPLSNSDIRKTFSVG